MEFNVPQMSKADFIQVLRHYGCRTITEAKLDEQIAAGAPLNENGTVNIVNYTAWVLKELCHAE